MGANRFRGTKNHAERRQQRPYRCKAEDAIIIFNVRIQPLHAGPHPVVALGFSHVYTFFVHRKSILQIVEEQKQREAMPPTIDIDFPSNSLLFPPPIIWDQWGQKITRWIEADDMATRWITTTSGQRAALISSHARSSQGSGSPIVVMDFNPWSVKKVQHALLKKKRKLEATAERKRLQVQMRLDQQNAEIVRKFRECKEWVERIERELGDIKAAAELGSSRSGSPKLRYTTSTDPIDFPRLDHSNVAEIKTFLEDHSEFVEHLDVPPAIQARAESSRTHQYEDSLMDELDSDGDDSDASSSKGDTERASWSLTGSHTVDRAGVCFSSPVESELPCVCYSSSQHFHYDGALVDEERILGIKVSRNLACCSHHWHGIANTFSRRMPSIVLKSSMYITSGRASPTDAQNIIIVKAMDKFASLARDKTMDKNSRLLSCLEGCSLQRSTRPVGFCGRRAQIQQQAGGHGS
jgi:hypothetical protein